jgi:hypothetical protein
MAMASNGLEWFRPVWRRAAITGFCVVWCAWEWLANRDQFWGFLTLALVAWAIWTFFINYDKSVGPPKDDITPPPA